MRGNSISYRSDIDGLRGVAVLLVVAFHAFPRGLKGGFVGVDVFFVISGYLIASLILADIRNGTFSIIEFYARRIRRLFPSLIVVLLGTLALAWLIFKPTEFRNIGQQVMGGSAFVSNLLLSRDRVCYFAASADAKPLLHLWSLGVEEQFYLAFPLFIWAVHRLFPTALIPLLAAAFAVSFAACAYGSLMHHRSTFFLPVTRVWEILLGSLMASFKAAARPESKTPWLAPGFSFIQRWRSARAVMALLGLAMIIGAAGLLSREWSFPGAWALLPTVGAALVIGAGHEAGVNRLILQRKWIVATGLISYPLYLWHWPLLSLVRICFAYRGPLSSQLTVACVASAAVLAFLTYQWVERPIRFDHILGAGTTRRLCSAMVCVFVIGLLTYCRWLPTRLSFSSFQSGLDRAEYDWQYPFGYNASRASGFAVDAELAKGQARPATLFIGDSHMQQYWPRIKYDLERFRDPSPVILITATATATLPGTGGLDPNACANFFEFAMSEAVKTNVGTVVITCHWERYFVGGFPHEPPYGIYLANDPKKTPLILGTPAAELVFAQFGRAVGELVARGKRVFVILSSPTFANWSPRSVPRFGDDLPVTNRLALSRQEFDAFVNPIERRIIAAVGPHGGAIINPRDALDEGGMFFGRELDGTFRYKDFDHMRPFYVLRTASFVDALIGTD